MNVRDIYGDENLQFPAWEFCSGTWSQHIIDHLTGCDSNGNPCSQQDIRSMLDQVDDLGDYSVEEWTMFFEFVRVEGI